MVLPELKVMLKENDLLKPFKMEVGDFYVIINS
jgi:hypothetical protein